MKPRIGTKLSLAATASMIGLIGCSETSSTTTVKDRRPAIGRILVECDSTVWEMNARDGSERKRLNGPGVTAGLRTASPSLRWGLEAEETGAHYEVRRPDGTTTIIPHRDLFAQERTTDGTAGARVQLTDFYGTYVVEQAHFGGRDSGETAGFISLLVTDIPDEVSHCDGAQVRYEGSETSEQMQSMTTSIVRLRLPDSSDIQAFSPALPTDPRCDVVLTNDGRHSIQFHAWDPGGQFLAFIPIHPRSIHVLDIGTRPAAADQAVAIPDTYFAHFDTHAWSPEGTRVLYRVGSSVWSVDRRDWRPKLLLDPFAFEATWPARAI